MSAVTIDRMNPREPLPLRGSCHYWAADGAWAVRELVCAFRMHILAHISRAVGYTPHDLQWRFLRLTRKYASVYLPGSGCHAAWLVALESPCALKVGY